MMDKLSTAIMSFFVGTLVGGGIAIPWQGGFWYFAEYVGCAIVIMGLAYFGIRVMVPHLTGEKFKRRE